MEQLLEILKPDDELKEEIIKQVNELDISDKIFINDQANRIKLLIETKSDIFKDNNYNYNFELNAIRLYLVRTLPDVSDKIIELLKNFNERLEISNELLSKRFEKKIKQKYQETVTIYDKPIDKVDKQIEISTTQDVKKRNEAIDDKVNELLKEKLGKERGIDEFINEYLQSGGGKEDTRKRESDKAKPTAKSEAEPTAESKSKPAAKSEAEPTAESKPAAESKSEAKLTAESKPAAKSEAEPTAESEVNPAAESKPAKSATEQKSKTNIFLQKLREIYNIFNTDIFLKLLGLMSYKENFNKIYLDLFKDDKGKANQKNFIDIFFFDKNDYQNLFNIFSSNTDYYINRDSNIYKIVTDSSDTNKILIYTLLNLIVNKSKESYDSIITTDENIKELIKLIINCSIRIRELKKLYKHFKDNIDLINIEYDKIIEKNKRVYTFIKERRDTITTNPRYKIRLQTQKPGETTTANNNYLLVKYYNTDEKIKYEGDYNPETYKDFFRSELNLKPEHYYFGPFDGIYTTGSFPDNKSVSDNAGPMLIKKLTNGQDICVIGYGQSGSGKTSSLIYLYSKQKDGSFKGQDGILIEICKHKTFTEYFKEIKVQAKNIYINFDESKDSMNSIGDNDYKVNDINFNKEVTTPPKETKEITFAYSNELWKSGADNLGDIINYAFEQREVEPTPNNPNSSRSHIIVCLTLIPKSKVGDTDPPDRKLIVCDLAGVENVFNCENAEEILKFDERYNMSDKYGEKKDVEFDDYYCKQKEEKPQTNIKLFDDYNENMKLIKGYSENITDYDQIIADLLNKSPQLINNFITNKQQEIKTRKDKLNKLLKDNKKDEETMKKELESKKVELEKIIKDFNKIINFFTDNKPNDINYTNITKKLKDGLSKNDQEINSLLIYYRIKITSTNEVQNNKRQYTDNKKTETNSSLFTIENLILYKNQKNRELLEGTTSITTQLSLFDKKDENTLIKLENLKKQLNISSSGKPLNQQSSGSTTCNTIEKLEVCDKKFNYIKDIIKDSNDTEKIIDEISRLKNNIDNLYIKFNEYLKDGTISDSNKKKLKTELIEYMDLLNNYKSWCCEHTRYLKLTHNCKLRRFEGYMINKSLSDMRVDIKSLIKQAIQISDGDNKFLPIFFDKQILPYCRNINYEDDIISSFYKNSVSGKETVNGAIIKTMEGFGVDLEKIVFAIFTVINLTDNGKVNNPPNPPYINLNNLIYNLEINFNLDKLKEEINEIHNLVQTYDFYKSNSTMIGLVNEKTSIIDTNDISSIKSHANRIIDLIKANNAATLIGSLESTDVLQNITYDKLVCSHNEKLSHLLRKFKGMELQQVINFNNIDNLNTSISNKYLKRYKINY